MKKRKLGSIILSICMVLGLLMVPIPSMAATDLTVTPQISGTVEGQAGTLTKGDNANVGFVASMDMRSAKAALKALKDFGPLMYPHMDFDDLWNNKKLSISYTLSGTVSEGLVVNEALSNSTDMVKQAFVDANPGASSEFVDHFKCTSAKFDTTTRTWTGTIIMEDLTPAQVEGMIPDEIKMISPQGAFKASLAPDETATLSNIKFSGVVTIENTLNERLPINLKNSNNPTITFQGAKEYTVGYQFYDSEGNDVPAEIEAIIPDDETVYEEEPFTPATPSSTNVMVGDTMYVFRGWYSDLEMTQEYVGGQPVSNFTILYGKWEPLSFTIEEIPTQDYTAEPIEPPLVVKHNGTLLQPGIDYDVTYTDNVKPGTATATVVTKGTYEGATLPTTFEIVNKYRFQALWVSSHENTYVTFNWTGRPDNKLATGWDIQYRSKLIGTQNPWTGWTSLHVDGKVLSKRLYLRPNHTIEFKIKHETENVYCRSVFTTPAGGVYQSVTRCQVKIVATASGATVKPGTSTRAKALTVGMNLNGDQGNEITIRQGQSFKITPNHVYPRPNFYKYPRLYPNHAWYDVADGKTVRVTGLSSTSGMMDMAVTVTGLQKGTTELKITSCNGRGMTLRIRVI